MEIDVILTPAEIALLPHRDLGATACVVFDVLRATSTFLTAFANGARRICPVTTIDEARELKARLPEALLGGERGGVRLEGFDLGNSPLEYRAERVRGRDIIATTTNGTVALRACAHAGAVFAGALINIDALALHLAENRPAGGRLLLVCAGTGGDFAIEDGYAAGALISRLKGVSCNDAAVAMRGLYEQHRGVPAEVLRASANGRRLREIGLGGDVEYCAAAGSVSAVAIMRDGALQAASE
jgi:2-phosphosulfolactate phosphatase